MKKVHLPLKILASVLLSMIIGMGTFSAENTRKEDPDDDSYLLTRLDRKDSYTFYKVTAKLYLDSLPILLAKENKKEQTEEERLAALKKKEYDVERPNLTRQEQNEIILRYVITPENFGFRLFYEKTKGDKPADIRAVTAESSKLINGPLSNPELSLVNIIMGDKATFFGKVALSCILMRPITSIKALKERQGKSKAFNENTTEKEIIRSVFAPIKVCSSALLSLYRPQNDPMLGLAYQKLLGRVYVADSNGKFTNKILIELKRRFAFDFSLILSTFTIGNLLRIFVYFLLGYFNSIANRGPLPEEAMFNNITAGAARLGHLVRDQDPVAIGILIGAGTYAVFIISVLAMAAYMTYGTYSTTTQYISGRIADFQTVIESAALVDQMVRRNPELEKYLGSELQYTRKVLSLQHENPYFNQLVHRILTNNFKRFSLFFNSSGTLLTTMSLLIDNLHVMDGILFELGKIEAWLAVSDLISNNTLRKNQYCYATYKEGIKPYIQLNDLWNPIVGHDSVANNFLIDANKQTASAITGPNACGKSIFGTAIGAALILGQTIGVVPAKEAVTTIFGGFFAFKEPKDDPARKKSLFATEVEAIDTVLTVLHEAKAKNYSVYIFADEFLKSTNIGEQLALQKVLISVILDTYPNSVSVICTHNFSLINKLVRDPRSQVLQVMIKRYQDGSYIPLYIVKEGKSTEKVGIDLFLKQISKNPITRDIGELIAKKSKQEYKKIEKQMERIK